ncbi:MAG TPA: 5-formyltetrahydrofolate cyclo-ligase [Saprospiraceae bacterium]|nr:5-formyltetrahydrofolate cyclo-ligase [Saprospiraceae bacterium]
MSGKDTKSGNEIRSQKKHLRAVFLRKRDALSAEYILRHSERICDLIWKEIMEKPVKSIFTYLPMGSEVNVNTVIDKCHQNNIKVLVPRILRKPEMQLLELHSGMQMKQGGFGTQIPDEEIMYEKIPDMALVPGLVFDLNGYRIGYGGGYYDFYLNKFYNIYSVGVCFPIQIKDNIPHESHDKKVKKILF